jgi:WD40 repeat protein
VWEVPTGKELLSVPVPYAEVHSLALSPDGKMLAVAGLPPEIRLLDATTLRELRPLAGHETRVDTVTFSPDGKLLASGGWDGKCRIWDVSTGRQRRSFEGRGRAVCRLAFSPDGKILAVGGGNPREPGILQDLSLVNAATGEEIRLLGQHRGDVHCLVFSPDGKTLASGGGDFPTRLWNVRTGRELKQFVPENGDKGSIHGLAFSPDGKHLATGDATGFVRLWEIASGKVLFREVGSYESRVAALAFSPDGKMLASAGPHSQIALWDVPSGKPQELVPHHRKEVLRVEFTPDGEQVVTAERDRRIGVWRSSDGKHIRWLYPDSPTAVGMALSPIAPVLATTGEDNTVCLWDLKTGRRQARFSVDDEHGLLCFSPDGKTLVQSGAGAGIHAYDVATGKRLWQDRTTRPDAFALAFTPDGGKLIVRSISKDSILVLDTTTRKLLLRITDPKKYNIALAPDGQSLFLAGFTSRDISRWSLSTGTKTRSLGETRSGVTCLAISPDGRTLASGSYEHGFQLWETATGCERTIVGKTQRGIQQISFSPDGKRLAVGGQDTTALIWDLTGQVSRKNTPVRAATVLWDELGGEDAIRAYLAMWNLAGSVAKSLPLLRERLQPVAAVDAEQLARLIANLESPRFAVREKATKELEKLGPLARSALEAVLKKEPTLELKRRVQQLLDLLESGPATAEDRRAVRAVEALEHIATPEARQLLQSLASGAPGAWLTEEARAASRRLK